MLRLFIIGTECWSFPLKRNSTSLCRHITNHEAFNYCLLGYPWKLLVENHVAMEWEDSLVCRLALEVVRGEVTQTKEKRHAQGAYFSFGFIWKFLRWRLADRLWRAHAPSCVIIRIGCWWHQQEPDDAPIGFRLKNALSLWVYQQTVKLHRLTSFTSWVFPTTDLYFRKLFKMKFSVATLILLVVDGAMAFTSSPAFTRPSTQCNVVVDGRTMENDFMNCLERKVL